MTREEVMQSNSLKKRFCKDYNIPITVFANPYFYQRLETIDKVQPCIHNFEMFCEEMEKYGNEQDYFENYNATKEKIINAIKENAEYNCFNYAQILSDIAYPKKNLYSSGNDGCVFVSIDMRKANFSALQEWSPKIFNDCQT